MPFYVYVVTVETEDCYPWKPEQRPMEAVLREALGDSVKWKDGVERVEVRMEGDYLKTQEVV